MRTDLDAVFAMQAESAEVPAELPRHLNTPHSVRDTADGVDGNTSIGNAMRHSARVQICL